MVARSLQAALIAGLLRTALAVPRPQVTYNSDPGNFPNGMQGPPTAAPGPSPATGSPYPADPSSLIGYNPSEDLDTSSGQIPDDQIEIVPVQTAPADLGLYLPLENVDRPQPIRGSTNSPTNPEPFTPEYDRMNSDVYAPPPTDAGGLPNGKWPMGLSHNRHGNPATAGWARQQNTNELPIATEFAGVDMRLMPNAYRELHWHKANEWAYITNGTARVAAVDQEGKTFIDDLRAGDVWFFPAGIPHSIQAKELGVEFILIFDDGEFSEDNTFLATELFLHTPKEVLAKDLRVAVSAFDDIPQEELYIFPGTPPPDNVSEQNTTGPAGIIPLNRTYSFHWSEQAPYEVPGGTIKFIDSSTFPVATNFAAAFVTLEPGAMRELHWHPTTDEWSFFLAGQARATVYSAPSSAQTFDFQAGDVAYIQVPNSHYIENTGNTTVVYIEMLSAQRFQDVSVGQWLGLTPSQVVKDTLNLSDDTVSRLPKYKPYIVPGNPDLTTTDFTEEAE